MTKNLAEGKAHALLQSTNPPQGRLIMGIKEILVPTDFTKASRETINYAVTLARSANAHLTLLHVFEQSHNLCYLRGSHVYDAIEAYRKDKEHSLQLLGDKVREDFANCSTVFRQGWHGDEIVRAANDLQSDLLIIGTHVEKWFQRIAYGSDSAAIVRSASCPVLVLHEHDSQFGNLNRRGRRGPAKYQIKNLAKLVKNAEAGLVDAFVGFALRRDSERGQGDASPAHSDRITWQ